MRRKPEAQGVTGLIAKVGGIDEDVLQICQQLPRYRLKVYDRSYFLIAVQGPLQPSMRE